MGIRACTASDAVSLSEVFHVFLVDDPDITPNFSVEFADRPSKLHLLRWGECLVARERSADGLVRALFRFVFGHGKLRAETIRLDAVPLSLGESVVAFPTRLRSSVWRIAPPLADIGARIVPMPYIDVDMRTRSIELPSPAAVDWEAATALAAKHGGKGDVVDHVTALTLCAICLPGFPRGAEGHEVLIEMVSTGMLIPTSLNGVSVRSILGQWHLALIEYGPLATISATLREFVSEERR